MLNSPFGPEEVWEHLPYAVQRDIIDKKLRFFAIDASGVARETGMTGRINTIMQTCFFALSEVLPREEAIAQIKKAIENAFKRGKAIIEQNFNAVDQTLGRLFEVKVPAEPTSSRSDVSPTVPAEAPEFVRQVTAKMMSGHGDELPVSALPADGTYPSGPLNGETNISDLIASWEPDLCVQCGNCNFVCPHSVIRSKFYHKDYLPKRPKASKTHPSVPAVFRKHATPCKCIRKTARAATCVWRLAPSPILGSTGAGR